MRNLVEVIDQMLDVIPDNECQVNLHQKLWSCKDSAYYTPPEAMAYVWKRVALVLNEYLGDYEQTEHWKREVQKIWMREQKE